MRRPLKPFVTEYKAGNRRPKDGSGGFGLEFDGLAAEAGAEKAKTVDPSVDQPRSRQTRSTQPRSTQPRSAGHRSTDSNSSEAYPSEAGASSNRQSKGQPGRRVETTREGNWTNDTARFSSVHGEDSYEAAMRAADALFSGASTRLEATSRETLPSDEMSHQLSSAADVFAKPQADAPAPPVGRILRAIDEAPDTALAEIEAERAPKRRGRKPGSKNKPKVQVTPPLYYPTPDALDNEDDEGIPFHEVPPAPRPSLPLQHAPRACPILVVRAAPRFAWVRTKLGPGDQWKRRLPKVIW